MISSMTGYARNSMHSSWGEMVWELRSVNHRGIEISIRMPERLRELEPQVRKCIADRFSRGRIDATFHLQRLAESEQQFKLNSEAIAAVGRQSDAIKEMIADVRPLSVADVLKSPGVVLPEDFDEERCSMQILDLLGKTVADLQRSRNAEGMGIQSAVQEKLQELTAGIGTMEELIPIANEEIRQKTETALGSYEASVDAARLDQEIALLLIKADVVEEFDRLRLHLDDLERTLLSDQVAGKRLGFIIQEISRELNTLGSKSGHYPLISLVVDMKVTIEQIREQVQNIE